MGTIYNDGVCPAGSQHASVVLRVGDTRRNQPPDGGLAHTPARAPFKCCHLRRRSALLISLSGIRLRECAVSPQA
jgi:hypothetical protein